MPSLTHELHLSVALQMFIVGSQLALVKNANPGIIPSTCALIVRFIIMPGLALLFVWTTAGRGWYVDDKLVWCVSEQSECTYTVYF